ncbi:MAG TPA: hypothetical protein VF698_04245 [Thermoanaerobaculia bacterium]
MKRLFRAVKWLPAVFLATLAGMAVRHGRRALRRKPRIWLGFRPIHSLADLTATARRAGYPARSIVSTSKQVKYPLVWDELFDRVLDKSGVPADEQHWYAMIDLLLRGDIWVAMFDCLFFVWHDRRNELVFRLLRFAGIRIIVATHGSDVVHVGPANDRYGWVERMRLDYPTWDLVAQGDVARRRIELFCRFADLVLPGDSSLAPWIPRCDALFKYFPIDTDAIAVAEPSSSANAVRIVHAPNHRNVKGTAYLIDAVQRVGGELLLVEGVRRDEALRIYAGADVVADQFIIGAFGTFALEGLALGKPVLTYLDEHHRRDPVFNLPIVHTTLENMDAVLAALLAVPELRARLGAASREAVVRYQSIDALAEVWDQLYRRAWWGTPLRLAQTRHFQRRARSMSEDPREAEFWPVDVGDLLPRIREAISRRA